MKRLILFPFILLLFSLFSQECDCNEVFNWTRKTFEENDAGFSYILEKKGEQGYAVHNELILNKVKDVTNPLECQDIISEWLSFFRFGHIQFQYVGELGDSSEDEEMEDQMTQESEEELYADNELYQRFLSSEDPFIDSLNEHTLYLRIPSFSPTEKSKIDSLVDLHKQKILSTQNLIIDIRNGTGGSDESYSSLMPFLYTNPIRMPSVEFLSTELNNQRMYEMSTNSGVVAQFGMNFTDEEMKEYRAKYDTLSKYLGEFVNLSKEKVLITTFDTVFQYPRKVGILINEGNASTDEQFILEAKQSQKVKLFGTTTMGALDMSNLYLAYSPDQDFVLVYALSKSLRIPGMAVDDIGIKPDFYLDQEIPESEWVDYVVNTLNGY
jgi:C-terminal processing protease CtpA/Prc